MATSLRLTDRLKGVIGDRTADALTKSFGMSTVEDLLRHYPRRYVVRGEFSDIAELLEGDEVTVLAEIAAVKTRRANGRNILEVNVTDGSAVMSLTFFNQPWREKELKIGKTGMFAGKVGSFNGKRQLSHPDYQLIPDGDDVDSALAAFAGKFLPVYPAGGKMPSWKISQCLEIILDSLGEIEDYLPESVRKEFGYPDLKQALISIHKPESLEAAELARMRLTFDEAILLQLLLAQRRAELKALDATPRKISTDGIVSVFEAKLPFKYTEGQLEVIKEIADDMQQSHPMHRLLQGEVGSGKTVVALRAMLSVLESGGQAALLAPTEVLAAQHFKTISKLLGDLAEAGTLQGSGEGTQLALLTGSLSAPAKRDALGKIKNGEAGIVIGTHALISEGVQFSDLALVVVDEQHRFGVEQRDALRMKATKPPHLLVMTATPIPRTVAMTIFGDLDVSTLRQLPSGRIPIQTHVIPVLEKPHYLERAWERVKEEIAKGHQAYIVAPRISSSEIDETKAKISEADIAMAKLMGDEITSEEISGTPDMASVEDLAPKLATGPLKGVKLAPLHGRQSSELKDETMAAFANGELDVLVATTVIEVGVDVPNASVMVIMDADRFGVSQLHQLRGRVGRGGTPGLCLLVSRASEDSSAMLRLTAVAGTLDGFELSRIDLDQRREGDVLGRAQSGTKSHLRLLRVLRDEELIEQARRVANTLIADDPSLAKYSELAAQVNDLREEERSAFLDKG
ncbi:MAG: ATP-dependent DNA helicase RecG [Actinobacteria bacterium]|uniref:ATP-dependent DNA helicase RecG n=1 Tax=freshwater metagenome TaxID=449393 RepID=A0A6J6P291_9ZZZZ|nr:ATP-dependent DNA helicase RecG [Actinomycetota bacterium]